MHMIRLTRLLLPTRTANKKVKKVLTVGAEVYLVRQLCDVDFKPALDIVKNFDICVVRHECHGETCHI